MRFFFAASIVAAACMARSAAFGSGLDVRIGKTTVFLGETVSLDVSLEGKGDVKSGPVFHEVPQSCSIERIGDVSTERMINVSIINGRRTTENKTVFSWKFVLTPRDPGTFDLGSVSIVSDDGEFSAKCPELTVIGPQKDPRISIEVKADRTNLTVTDRFRVTLSVGIDLPHSENIPEYPFKNARLFIPYIGGAEGEKHGVIRPSGVDLNTVLSELISSSGFQINEISVQSGPLDFDFSLFPESRAALFALRHRDVERGDGKITRFYDFPLDFEAVEPGETDFGPVYLRGEFLVPDTGSGRPVLKTIFTGSESVTVRISDPPEEGRPSGFCGIIGTNVTASAELDAQTCREGDPLELVLTVRGNSNPAGMQRPDLREIPGFSKMFRLYGDISEKQIKDGVSYTYRLRPLISGTIEFPSIPISYFNTVSRRYESADTDPIPLRVDEVPELEIEETQTAEAGLGIADIISPAGIFASSSSLIPAPEHTLSEIVIFLLLPPLAVFAILQLTGLWKKRTIAAGFLRRSSAGARASRALKRAETPRDVMAATTLLLRDKFGEKCRGLTPEEVSESLLANGVPDDLRREFCDELEHIFNSAYLPGGSAERAFKESVARLSSVFDRLRSVSRIIITVAAFSLLAADARANYDAGGREFVWRQANAAASHSSSAADFRAAAGLYRSLIDTGRCGAGVYANYGVMEMLAGEPEAALEAFRRAEILGGYSPETARNIVSAYRRTDDLNATKQKQADAAGGGETGLPWFRDVFPLHYILSMYERTWIAFILWSAAWLAVLFKLMAKRFRRRLCVVAVFLFVLAAVMATSAAYSGYVMSRPLPGVSASVGQDAASGAAVRGMGAP